ncbi:MAG: histidine triad nucleotide-binding protein [Chloroflexi bacterium]|nr:histidine triad nucleotide-binding protein [Chloroflexota bacterium]MBV9546522.1 histidine triad nucleotide-binding protein [Chloroflexota bacterium]
MTADPDCIFCKIVGGQIPAGVVYQDERATAFRDLNPQAPVHILVVPKEHIANTTTLSPENDATVGALVRVAHAVAQQEGVAETGYRLVVNTGRDANNTVAHLHIHVLGGRSLGWPPG